MLAIKLKKKTKSAFVVDSLRTEVLLVCKFLKYISVITGTCRPLKNQYVIFINLYTYIYIYIYTYIHIFTYTYIYIYIYVYTYMYIYKPIYVNIRNINQKPNSNHCSYHIETSQLFKIVQIK